MSYLCLHMQAPIPDWPQHLARAHAAGRELRLRGATGSEVVDVDFF